MPFVRFLFYVLCTFIIFPVWAEDALYGHLAYNEAKAENLVKFQGIPLHKEALPALKKMQAAARRDGVKLVILSGFRSVKRQNYLFYGIAQKRGQKLEERAKVSAPPAHSEHHTGFAFDFDDGDTPVRLKQSFAHTKAGKWLAAHAMDYGFEMSFPPHNAQGVMYEPWHWRWVGSLENCALFDAARQKYPESVGVDCP